MSDRPDFKKFAAELVSPSEIFESRSTQNRNAVTESIELLGSLAHLTRASLATPQNIESTAVTATNSPTPSANVANTADTAAEIQACAVRYATSREEYRRALEDARITQALAHLQNHREKTAKQPSHSVIRSSTFQTQSAPQVNNVTVKQTRLTNQSQRPSHCQPILRENDPTTN
jgi:hypothetical protein